MAKTFPWPKAGDSSEDVTYAAVGFALSNWEGLEAELCALYGAFHGWQPAEKRTIEGYSKGRRIFVDRLAAVRQASEMWFRQYCHQANEGKFTELMHETEELSKVRNRIAHAIVLPYSIGDVLPGSTRVGNAGYTYCLVPAYYDSREQEFFSEDYMDFKPVYALVSSDIRALGYEFNRLRMNIFNFRQPINLIHI